MLEASKGKLLLLCHEWLATVFEGKKEPCVKFMLLFKFKFLTLSFLVAFKNSLFPCSHFVSS